jgi:hypothetical protein
LIEKGNLSLLIGEPGETAIARLLFLFLGGGLFGGGFLRFGFCGHSFLFYGFTEPTAFLVSPKAGASWRFGGKCKWRT